MSQDKPRGGTPARDCGHEQFRLQDIQTPTFFEVFEVPINELRKWSGLTCRHRHLTHSGGWYLYIELQGANVVVLKVGESGRLLGRARGQRSKFPSATSVLLIASPALAAAAHEPLRKQVEWQVGLTLVAVAAESGLPAPVALQFTSHSDKPFVVSTADTLAQEVLKAIAVPLHRSPRVLSGRRRRPVSALTTAGRRGPDDRVLDLIMEGAVLPGATLYSRNLQYTSVVGDDGRLRLPGLPGPYTPRAAAKLCLPPKSAAEGFDFWRVRIEHPDGRVEYRSLRQLEEEVRLRRRRSSATDAREGDAA